MIPRTDESDALQAFVEHYSRWHRHGGKLSGAQVDAIVTRAIEEEMDGREQDMAVGIAILSAELGIRANGAFYGRTVRSATVRRVARFLHWQFAPPTVLCILARLSGGKPVEHARATGDYVTELMEILPTLTRLPRAVAK